METLVSEASRTDHNREPFSAQTYFPEGPWEKRRRIQKRGRG